MSCGTSASASVATAANSGSTNNTLVSACSSMKAKVLASKRVFKVLSTAPAIGTAKCASIMAGMLGSSVETVSFLPMPSFWSWLANWRQRLYVSRQVIRR